MPLPTKDAITFRGTPSCGDKATIALSLKLTQRQVEAIFARQESINKHPSTQFPLEIDFDTNKLYIGNTTTSFDSGKEFGIRDICRRTPSLVKPLAGLFLSAAAVGKLIIPKEIDDAASDLRKATEAEQTKKNGRGILRMDAPIAVPNGKKSRLSGTISLTRKATIRVVSPHISSITPPLNFGSTNSSKLPPSHSSSSLSTTIPITSGAARRPNAAPGSRGCIYSNIHNKKGTAKLRTPNMTGASFSKPSLTPTSSTVPSASKSSIKPRGVNAMSKPGISCAPSRNEPSQRPLVPARGSNRKRKLADLVLEPTSDLEEGEIPMGSTSDMEEGEIPSTEHKKRSLPEATKPDRARKFEHNRDTQGTEIAASHKRKATFSDENDRRPTKRIAGTRTARPSFATNTTTLAPKANNSRQLISGLAILPDNKEGICREYGRYFAHYLHTISKFYAQKSKVEAALALDDGAGSTAEGDSDLMDSKELTELCEEFHRTRNELERIQKAHQNLDANVF